MYYFLSLFIIAAGAIEQIHAADWHLAHCEFSSGAWKPDDLSSGGHRRAAVHGRPAARRGFGDP